MAWKYIIWYSETRINISIKIKSKILRKKHLFQKKLNDKMIFFFDKLNFWMISVVRLA